MLTVFNYVWKSYGRINYPNIRSKKSWKSHFFEAPLTCEKITFSAVVNFESFPKTEKNFGFEPWKERQLVSQESQIWDFYVPNNPMAGSSRSGMSLFAAH